MAVWLVLTFQQFIIEYAHKRIYSSISCCRQFFHGLPEEPSNSLNNFLKKFFIVSVSNNDHHKIQNQC
ncbi:hypothetical protein DAI22_03g260400 [Oryza sativa Japonica Group]|nr:hypothetical protein DAI22_03g260400 [Oryza sativa Japonica Group]